MFLIEEVEWDMTDNKLNPFSIDAVATFGSQTNTCENLEYVQRARDEVAAYLTVYPRSDARFGGAIALSGVHGAGKTHLLGWLAKETPLIFKGPPGPIVAYAKVDSDSAFDLYRQLFEGIPRATLVEVVSLAFRVLGEMQAEKAQVTTIVAERIRSGTPMNVLYDEGNMDLDELTIHFKKLLLESGLPQGFSQKIGNALLLINHPIIGNSAYEWLSGAELSHSIDLGVNLPLRDADASQQASPDTVAVNALEALAWLFSLARVPFLLLVDQMERLFRASVSRRETLFSILKKLIEQVSRQNGLIALAGTPEAWAALPRDVWPRFRNRRAFPVGEISVAETQALVVSYARTAEQLAPSAFDLLHSVSGGVPREIIRICYQLFESVEGNFSTLVNDFEKRVVEAARTAGTLSDRRELALLQIDRVATKHGMVFREFEVAQSVRVDRILQIPSVGAVAFEILQPGDASDVQIVKNLTNLREIVGRKWPRSTLIAISVGYSKSVITSIIQDAVVCLEFREEEFEFRLIGEIEKFVMENASATQQIEDETVRVLKEQIRLLRGRLEEFETREKEEGARIQQRLSSATEKTAQPMRTERERKTRWEIVDGLSELHQALLEGDGVREREILYSLLIANEAHVKSSRFEHLGGVYLDIVDAEALAGRRVSETASDDGRLYPAVQLRSELVSEMRDCIREKGLQFMLVENPIKSSIIWGAVSVAAAVIWCISATVVEPTYSGTPQRVAVQFLSVCGGMILLGGYLYLTLWMLRFRKDRRITQNAKYIKEELQSLANQRRV
jgi:hypothetical protein